MRQMGVNYGLYNLKDQTQMYKADSAADAYFDIMDAIKNTYLKRKSD